MCTKIPENNSWNIKYGTFGKIGFDTIMEKVTYNFKYI